MSLRERAELAAAGLVVAVRLLWPSPRGLWRDWILVLALYGALLAWKRAEPHRPWVSVAVALYLFAVHAVPQMAFTLDQLRLVL